MPIPLRRHLIAAAKLLLGVALMVVVVRWLSPDLETLRARAPLSLPHLALAFSCTLCAAIVTSARWMVMIEAMGGTRLPYAAYFHGLVLTKVVGQFTSALAMDLVGRGLALRSAGSERGLGHSMTQAIVERIFDLLLPIALVVWAITIRSVDPTSTVAAASFAGICLAFALLASLILWPVASLALRLYLVVVGWRGRAVSESERAQLLASPISKTVARQVGVLSVLRYLAVLGQYWGVAAAIGITFDFRTIASATPLGQLAGILGVTPGGLGIQEAGWAGALRWLDVIDDPAIGLFVVSQRVLIFVFFSVLSLLSWPWLRRALARYAEPAAKERPVSSDTSAE